MAQPAGEPGHHDRPAGLVAVVAVLFGSTAFDAFRDTARWVRFVDDLDIDVELTCTVALLVFCLVVGLSFTIATMTTGVDAAVRPRRSALPSMLAHSVVSITVGYMTAHYLSYFVEQGRRPCASSATRW